MSLLQNKRIMSGYLFVFIITLGLKAVGFSLISNEAMFLKYTFFLLLTIAVGIHFYKRACIYMIDMFIITGLSCITLFLFRDPLLLAMLLTLIVLLMLIVAVKKFEGKRTLKIIALFISSCLLLVSIILSMLFLAFGFFLTDFVLTEEIRTVPSPNGNYSLVVVNVDQGALGGNTLINVRRSYLGMVEWKGRIYIGRWGEQPNIEWAGNHEISVNGEHRRIFFGTTLDKR
jgi:hypothetical protein